MYTPFPPAILGSPTPPPIRPFQQPEALITPVSDSLSSSTVTPPPENRNIKKEDLSENELVMSPIRIPQMSPITVPQMPPLLPPPPPPQQQQHRPPHPLASHPGLTNISSDEDEAEEGPPSKRRRRSSSSSSSAVNHAWESD
uniref:Uncharacterized protein n=1 Tax=Panagrolaimus sp. ES5 TaxID=591445 RepID=A0AC34GIT6_9BILA